MVRKAENKHYDRSRAFNVRTLKDISIMKPKIVSLTECLVNIKETTHFPGAFVLKCVQSFDL